MGTPHLFVFPPNRMFRATTTAVINAAGRCGASLTLATRLPRESVDGASHVVDVVSPPEGDGPDSLERMRELVEAAHRRRPLAQVVTFHEAYVELAAAVNAALGLGGNPPETARRCRDKFLMRQALRAQGVPVPAFRLVRSFEEFAHAVEAVGVPCVSKPVAASMSKGVVKVGPGDRLRDAYEFTTAIPEVAAHGGGVLVEEYVGGPEFSVEVVVAGGVPMVAGCTAKTTEPEPLFGEIMHVFPAPIPEADAERLRVTACDAVQALGIVEGGVHLEARLAERGPVVMECAARLAGDAIPLVVQLATGVDLYECVLRVALGQAPPLRARRGRTGGVRFLQTEQEGVLRAAAFDKSQLRAVRGLVAYGLLRQSGDFIARPPRGVTNRLGFAMAAADTPAAVCDALLAAERALTYTIAPGGAEVGAEASAASWRSGAASAPERQLGASGR